MASEEKTITFSSKDDIGCMELEEKQKSDMFDILIKYRKNQYDDSIIRLIDARQAYYRENIFTPTHKAVQLLWKKKGNLQIVNKTFEGEYKKTPNGLYYYVYNPYGESYDIIFVDPKRKLTDELVKSAEDQIKKQEMNDEIDTINRQLKNLPDEIKHLTDKKKELLKNLKDKQLELEIYEKTKKYID